MRENVLGEMSGVANIGVANVQGEMSG